MAYSERASVPQTKPVLTMSVPIGVELGEAVGDIRVQGADLQVQPDTNLALVGGNVSLNDAQLTTPPNLESRFLAYQQIVNITKIVA